MRSIHLTPFLTAIVAFAILVVLAFRRHMSITITPAVGSRRVILRNGGDAGMIERGKAYAQGLTAPELRELADRMDEAGA